MAQKTKETGQKNRSSFKGLRISDNIIKIIMAEADKQKRSFSGQVNFIIEDWIRKNIPAVK